MSAANKDRTPGERDEIEALLPWYVSGKLDAQLAARIARHIEAHPELERQVALIRAESDATISGNENIRPLGPAALDRLRASVAANPRNPSLRMRLDSWRNSITGAIGTLAPSQLALAGSAAALLILVQAAAIGVLMIERGNPTVYATAAGPQVARSGIEILVGFRDTATAGEINALLKEVDAHIVDGPRSGLYRLRVPETDAADHGHASLLRSLQQSDAVGIVLPGK